MNIGFLSLLLALSSGAQRAQIRSTLFVPDPLPALAPQSHGQFELTPGVIAERVTYRTQFGMRVPAIVYRPKVHAGKLPALIVRVLFRHDVCPRRSGRADL